MMDASKMSAIIRAKKKKMMEADPEIIGTSPTPDMNAQDIYNLDKQGQIENMLDVSPKIDADETMMNAPSDDEIMSMDKKRMARLRSMLNSMDLSD